MTNRSGRGWWPALSLALLSGFFLAGCNRGAAGGDSNVIRIGHYASMTGPTATFGTSTDEGIRLALEQINAKGGVLGKQVEVLTEDDQSKPSEAVNAVE